MALLKQAGLLHTPDAPSILWASSHDEAVRLVLEGRAEAGAVKSMRLEAFLAANPTARVRRIADGSDVPESSLCMRKQLPVILRRQIAELLLGMEHSADGRAMLAQLGFVRFVACRSSDFAGVYDLADVLADDWDRIGLSGPVPRRPAGVLPALTTRPVTGEDR